MCTKLLTILIALACCSQLIATQRLTQATKFDDYMEILQNTKNVKQKLRLQEAIWAQIRADYPADLNKTTNLYQQLHQQNANGTSAKVQQALEELEQEIRFDLIAKNAQLLAKSINGKYFFYTIEIENFIVNLQRNFDATTFLQINTAAIDLSYNLLTLSELAEHLRQLYNARDYELFVQTQLYLYWKFVNRHDKHEEYLFNAAYYFSTMTKHISYPYLSFSLMTSLNAAIWNLPPTLYFLHYQYYPYFYIVGDNGYLSTNGSLIDSNRSYVYNKLDKESANINFYTNITELPYDGKSLKLEFTFTNREYNSSLYLEQSDPNYMNFILAWQNKTPLMGGAWTLQYLDDKRLALSQNGWMMCVGDRVGDRSNILAYNDAEHTTKNPKCQWSIGMES